MKKKLIYISILFISLFMTYKIEDVKAKDTENDWIQLTQENLGLICKYEFNDNADVNCYIYRKKTSDYKVQCYYHERKNTEEVGIENWSRNIKSIDFKVSNYIKSKFICPKYIVKKDKNSVFERKIYLFDTKEKMNQLIQIENLNSNYAGKNIESAGPTDAVNKRIKRNQTSGCNIFGPEGSQTRKYIKWAINIIRYAIPILIVVFGITEYLGVIFSGEDKYMKEAQKRVILRIVIGLIALLLPSIIKLLINISGLITGVDSGDIFCGFI